MHKLWVKQFVGYTLKDVTQLLYFVFNYIKIIKYNLYTLNCLIYFVNQLMT